MKLALIGQAVLKIIKNNGHENVYSPWQGQTVPWVKIFFININCLFICCKFYPLNDFVTFFPFNRIGVQI